MIQYDARATLALAHKSEAAESLYWAGQAVFSSQKFHDTT
jgi:hypothetical protein